MYTKLSASLTDLARQVSAGEGHQDALHNECHAASGCGWVCAVEQLTTWASSLVASTTRTSSCAVASVPHQHLLLLAAALQQHTNSTDAPGAQQQSVLPVGACRQLIDGVLQLACAASSTTAHAASTQVAYSSTGLSPSSTGLHSVAVDGNAAEGDSPEQGVEQGLDPGSSQAAAESFKAVLSWACHMTTLLHTYISTASTQDASLRPSNTANRRPARGAATAATPAKPAAAGRSPEEDATAPAPHYVPSKLQERWQQHVLPDVLRQLLTCYQTCLSSTNGPACGSSSCGSSLGSRPAGLTCGSAAAASPSDGAACGIGQPGSSILSQHMSSKEWAAADKLLYGVCTTLLNSTEQSNAPGTKPRKPPLKQPRTSSGSKAAARSSLSQECKQLCASLLGCHLLFRHQQQAFQMQEGVQPSPMQWRWCAEVCRTLADPAQVALQVLVPEAFMSLLQQPSTRPGACQMLCVAAAAVFPGRTSHAEHLPAHQPQQQQPKKQAGKPGRQGKDQQPQQPSSDTSAGEDTAVLLLELLACIFRAPWRFPCGGDATAASSSHSWPATAAARTAAQLQWALASAMLPTLQPAASLASAAARKHWLFIAAAAAAARQPAAVPTADGASSWLAGAATAAPEAAVTTLAPAAAATAAIAAAAAKDKDANVRSKALGLLQELAPCLLQQWAAFRAAQPPEAEQVNTGQHAQQPHALQLQQHTEHANQGAPMTVTALEARTEVRAESSVASQPSEPAADACRSMAAVLVAVQSQLLGSSKACRLKALQLLQQLLRPLVLSAGSTGAASRAAANGDDTARTTAAAAAEDHMRQLLQHCAISTYPAVCSVLAAGQDSPLHCLSCKAAAQQVLHAMAVVLEPRQALQLALSSSTAAARNISHSSSTCADGRGAEHAVGQQLLLALAGCSEHQLYELLQNELMAPWPGTVVQHNATTVDGCTTPTLGAAGSNACGTQLLALPQQLQAQQQMLPRLQGLLQVQQQGCSSEGLRRHAFAKLVQVLAAAAADNGRGSDSVANDSSTDSRGAAAQTTEPTPDEHVGTQAPAGDGGGSAHQERLLCLQRQLLVAVQLLQVSGGCCRELGRDLRGELAILADTMDLCMAWLQQQQHHLYGSIAPPRPETEADADANGAAATTSAAEGAARVGLQMQGVPAEGTLRGPGSAGAGSPGSAEQGGAGSTAAGEEGAAPQRQEVQQTPHATNATSTATQSAIDVASSLVCHALLSSLLNILADAAGRAAAMAAAKPGAPAPAAAGAGRGHVWLWGSIGGCLLHHLDFVVLLASCDGPARLSVHVLDTCLQALCWANSRQPLLHDLLLHWHQQLQAAPANTPNTVAAAAAAPPALQAGAPPAPVPLEAFLLLIKHLSAFYELERACFRQQLLSTLGGATAAAPTRAADMDAAAAAHGASEAAHGANATRQQKGQTLGSRSSTGRMGQASSGNANEGPQQPQQQHLQPSFDYMLGEEEAVCVDVATKHFVANLLDDTAPACYTPVLVQLMQTSSAPGHVRVLALQALEPLLLVSADFAAQHCSALVALMSSSCGGSSGSCGSCTPALLLQQAVATAGKLAAARPAQSTDIVAALEQLMLRGLSCKSKGQQGRSAGVAQDAGKTAPPEQHAYEVLPGPQQPVTACSVALAAATSAAANCYCHLLLSEKLLLTGYTWGVVAAGLLGTEQLQGVSAAMQQLVQGLVESHRLPPVRAALGLLLNFTPPQIPHTPRQPPPTTGSSVLEHADAAAAVPAAEDGSRDGAARVPSAATGRLGCRPGLEVDASGGLSTCSMGARAPALSHCAYSQLVQEQLLGWLLQPADLAAEELIMPLLQALGMALATVRGHDGSSIQDGAGSSSSSGSNGGAAAAMAQLLAACSPSGRCLDALLRVCQAHKHSMALACPAPVLQDLLAFARNANISSSTAATTSSRGLKGAAAAKKAAAAASSCGDGELPAAMLQPAAHAATQAKLLALLQDIAAASSTAVPTGPRLPAGITHGGSSAAAGATTPAATVKHTRMQAAVAGSGGRAGAGGCGGAATSTATPLARLLHHEACFSKTQAHILDAYGSPLQQGGVAAVTLTPNSRLAGTKRPQAAASISTGSGRGGGCQALQQLLQERQRDVHKLRAQQHGAN